MVDLWAGGGMDANELGLATDEAGVIGFFEPRMNTDFHGCDAA